MAANAREFLWIVKESALGTLMSTPVAGTDSMYIRLVDGNSFSMATKPVIEKIPYGGGFAVTAEAVSDHYELAGQLKTKLYPSQAQLLMDWACTRVNAAQTIPWVTTEPPNDLASCTVYHAVQRSDGTLRRKRYAGVKVGAMTIEVSRESTTAMITLDLVGSKSYGNPYDSTSDPDATAFPAPAESDYPTGPYTFKHTSTGLKVASTVSSYTDLSIKVQNALSPQWFENSYRSLIQFCGRASTLDATLLFKASPDRRTAYEALTAQDTELTFSNGTHTAKIDFNGQNTIDPLTLDLPLDQAFMEKLSLFNRFDVSATSDIAVSFT
jgi:hypothetical protein